MVLAPPWEAADLDNLDNTILLEILVEVWLFLIKTGIVVPNSLANSIGEPLRVGDSDKASSRLGSCHFSSDLGRKIFLFKGVENYELPDGGEQHLFLGTNEPFLNLNADLSLFYLIRNESYYLREDYLIRNEGYYLRKDYLCGSPDGVMASQASGSSGPGAGGIPLHEFRRDVPPGWAPNIPDYSLRLYFERLKLWYRIYEGDDTMVGPLVAGRLQGKAQRLGMQLRLARPDGGVDVGSDAQTTRM